MSSSWKLYTLFLAILNFLHSAYMVGDFDLLQPHSPGNRALAQECKDVKIDRVYIGSCTGGKTEDFLAAAKLLAMTVS